MKFSILLGAFLSLHGCNHSRDESTSCSGGESDGAIAATEKVHREHRIEVCWEGEVGETFARERDLVASSLQEEISSHTGIYFFGWKPCGVAGQRAIHVDVVDALPRTLGVGTDLIGEAKGVVLNFTFKSWNVICGASDLARTRCIRAIAVHEFMHVLGMVHEHSRADTPTTCVRERLEKPGTETIGSWDAQSVMNYCNSLWNNGGHLSKGDIEALRQLYPQAKPSSDHNGEGGSSKSRRTFIPNARNAHCK